MFFVPCAPIYHARRFRYLPRIVQYKMILKRDLIPIQDDPEKMRSQGVWRPVANTHGERRNADRSTDPGVPQRQPGDRVRRAEPRGTVPVGAASAGGPGVRGARQEAAGYGSSLHEQSHGAEPAPDDAADPAIPGRGCGDRGGVPTPKLSEQVQQSRHRSTGGAGSRAPLAERAGDGAHSETGARTIRQIRIRTTGGDLGGASVQSAAGGRTGE